MAQKTIINHRLPFPNGEYSDSRVMAWLASVHGKTFLQFIENQKITVLTTKGIIKYGSFDKYDGKKKEDGLSVSNTYFDNSCYSSISSNTSSSNQSYDNLDNKKYCDYCDSLKPLEQFSFNDECCNTCFDDSYEKELLKEKKASMNEVLNENMINAKQYSKESKLEYKTQFDHLRESRKKRMFER